MKKKMKCMVCGERFEPDRERTYQVQEVLTGLAALSGSTKIHDAIDCPRCGCQTILNIRLPVLEERSREDESCS